MPTWVSLPGGKILIDDEFLSVVQLHDWRIIIAPKRGGAPGPARVIRQWREGGKGSRQHRETLSRVITGAALPAQVYFLNGNPLDLRRENLEVGRRPPPHRIRCPYTPEQLYQMYWREGDGSKQIGVRAAHLLERKVPVAGFTVRIWLREAGVTLRTKGEVNRIMVRRDPVRFQLALQKARAVYAEKARRGEIKPQVSHLHSKAAQRKSHQAARRTFRARRRLFECTRPNCGKQFTRMPSQIRPGQTRFYCSPNCAGKDLFHAWKRRLLQQAEGLPYHAWRQAVREDFAATGRLPSVPKRWRRVYWEAALPACYAQWQSGARTKDIAATVGVTLPTLLRAFDTHKYQISPENRSVELNRSVKLKKPARVTQNSMQRENSMQRDREIEAAMKTGQRQSEIARTLGVSRQRINQIVRRMADQKGKSP